MSPSTFLSEKISTVFCEDLWKGFIREAYSKSNFAYVETQVDKFKEIPQ
jgi:hypothetical protein